MQKFIELFLSVYFWVFPVATVLLTLYGVKLKSKSMKMKDQTFLELLVATTLYVVSILY
jgi:hypothetical protein